jgi:hypothetical protein
MKVKKNKCPYCTYPCDRASMVRGKEKPRPGSLSFCLMCCELSEWDKNMKLQKFDINSIPDLIERNKIKSLGMHMIDFWEQKPDTTGRREKYLKIMDTLNAK